MKSMVSPVLALSFLLALSAQAESSDLGFITGSWRGVDGTTLIEETWSRSENGQMIGMFRLVENGEPRFFELMTIENDGDGWVMYLRHFNPGLGAWEEKDGALAFDLLSVEGSRAVFDQRGADTRLVYELEGTDRLTVTLEKLHEDEWRKTPFVYERAN